MAKNKTTISNMKWLFFVFEMDVLCKAYLWGFMLGMLFALYIAELCSQLGVPFGGFVPSYNLRSSFIAAIAESGEIV